MQSELNLSMGVVMAIIFIYATINTFRVKSKELSSSFRVVGVAFVFTILIKFSMGFFVVSPYGHIPSMFITLI